MQRFNIRLIILFICASFIAPPQSEIADAGGGSKIVYAGRKKVALSPNFQNQMQCVAKTMEEKGYRPRDIGCFGHRPNNRSAHPTGHACDVDQYARDKTNLNRFFSRSQQNSIARGCRAVSGCVWRRPDCGHFEQISAPYSAEGAGMRKSQRKYHYGKKHANRGHSKNRQKRRKA